MKAQTHILNGDALLDRFPKEIEGEKIIMREALIEGPKTFKSYHEFYSMRAKYFKSTYHIGGYLEQSAREIDKILAIQKDHEIYLWFEDDLFCQANFWFLMHFFEIKQFKNPIFLVRPPKLTHYGFAALNKEELIANMVNKIDLKADINYFSELWTAYSKDEFDNLKRLAAEAKFEFAKNAIEAHIISRFEPDSSRAPIGLTKLIIKEIGTTDFGTVFQEFSKRAPIYGFGDLQFRKIWEKAIQ